MLDVTAGNFKTEVKESPIPVVLDFWAPWCGPCRSIGPILEQLGQEFEGRVKVAKVNIDNEPQLAQAFSVRSIPMIVGLVEGDVRENSVGFRGERPLREMFERLAK